MLATLKTLIINDNIAKLNGKFIFFENYNRKFDILNIVIINNVSEEYKNCWENEFQLKSMKNAFEKIFNDWNLLNFLAIL